MKKVQEINTDVENDEANPNLTGSTSQSQEVPVTSTLAIDKVGDAVEHLNISS